MPRIPKLPRQHQYEDFGEDDEEPRYMSHHNYEDEDGREEEYGYEDKDSLAYKIRSLLMKILIIALIILVIWMAVSIYLAR